MPLVFQQTQVWCWAASAEMVFRYYGRGATQCQVLSAWYLRDCCTFPGFCLSAAPNMEVIQQTLLSLGGVRSRRAFGPLSQQQIVSEISAGRPIIMAYLGSFSGHVVVLYGYEANGGVLHIHDPIYGTHRVPYGATFTYFGQLIWADSLVGLAP